RRSSTDEAPGLGEELIGETGAIAWGRSRHRTAPVASDQVFLDDALTLSPPRSAATLQLFAEWTTKPQAAKSAPGRTGSGRRAGSGESRRSTADCYGRSWAGRPRRAPAHAVPPAAPAPPNRSRNAPSAPPRCNGPPA